jgi:hypothetical protein
MSYAGRVKKPLGDIAVIDQDTIDLIVDALPENPGSYTHPATHPATMITEDTDHNFVTTTEKNKLTTLTSGLTQSQILIRQL